MWFLFSVLLSVMHACMHACICMRSAWGPAAPGCRPRWPWPGSSCCLLCSCTNSIFIVFLLMSCYCYDLFRAICSFPCFLVMAWKSSLFTKRIRSRMRRSYRGSRSSSFTTFTSPSPDSSRPVNNNYNNSNNNNNNNNSNSNSKSNNNSNNNLIVLLLLLIITIIIRIITVILIASSFTT